MIVLDANVFAKLFVTESDSDDAKALLYAIQYSAIPVLLPSLFTYEIIQIGRYHSRDTDEVLELLKSQLVSNWKVMEPTSKHWKTAQRISQEGHLKSGYPSMYDSIYQALAIEEDGDFITADKKHYAKAHSFGRIFLLENWKSPLEPWRVLNAETIKVLNEREKER